MVTEKYARLVLRLSFLFLFLQQQIADGVPARLTIIIPPPPFPLLLSCDIRRDEHMKLLHQEGAPSLLLSYFPSFSRRHMSPSLI
jgi:hypothetical protein